MRDFTHPTRRRVLQAGLRASALAAAAALLPPRLRQALARAPERPGSLRDVRHVVLLMQENRSFDHYFGALSGVRGFGDRQALRLADGRSVFHQPDRGNPLGYLLPFHLDTRTSSAQALPSNSHSWPVQHEAWNGGRMDRWVAAHRRSGGDKGPYTMGYFRREDIPFHWALADAFTICDHYHASVMGPTWPNRLYFLSGTIGPQGGAGGPVISNRMVRGGFRWTTYAERLERAGVSWRVYEFAKKGRALNLLNRFANFRNAPGDSPLGRKGVPDFNGDAFEDDALNGRLPAVSWLFPEFSASEHPHHLPAAGAAFIARVLDVLASRPEVWRHTVFILNYDENDGLFDHVPPPVPPAGAAGEFVGGVPIGAGFRVPCIVVSPWTAGGWVCSEPFDHTSVLRFLERFTGVPEPNISDWRRQTFGDLTSAFRFDQADGRVPALPATAPLLRAARAEVEALPAPPVPAGDQRLPRQDAGRRPRVPRPKSGYPS